MEDFQGAAALLALMADEPTSATESLLSLVEAGTSELGILAVCV